MTAAAQPPTFRAELARKALHVGTAIVPVAWAMRWCSETELRWTLAAATIVALLIEALRRSPGLVQRAFAGPLAPMLRPHESQALTGATWLALTMAAVAWLAPPPAAIAGLWAAAVGDAAAAVVGRGVSALRRRTPTQKTWTGSAAATASTMLGVLWLTAATPTVAAALGLVAAAAERPRLRLDDNLRVGGAVALAATLLGLR